MDTITDVCRSADGVIHSVLSLRLVFFLQAPLPTETTVPSVEIRTSQYSSYIHIHIHIVTTVPSDCNFLGCPCGLVKKGLIPSYLRLFQAVDFHQKYIAFIQHPGTQFFEFHRAHAVALSSWCIILHFPTVLRCSVDEINCSPDDFIFNVNLNLLFNPHGTSKRV